MPENITYNKLMKWHMEIQDLQDADRILSRFLQSKIREFYKQNSIRINTFIERLNEKDRKYCEFDDKGVVYEDEAKRIKKLLPDIDRVKYDEVTKEMWGQVIAIEI